MTPDPAEGVADDGIISTGASRDNLHPAYARLLDETVGTLRAALGPALHSVYVYGSVATGQARPPRSDLDVVAVTTTDLDRSVDDIADDLTARHRSLVREVGIGSVSLETLGRSDLNGCAERCFLKHYCVHLAGQDIRSEFASCRPPLALAVGFNGNLGTVLAQLREQLVASPSEPERHKLVTRACRKILMSAATLLSVREGGWSTDRVAAVGLITRHNAALGLLAQRALAFCDPTSMPARAEGGCRSSSASEDGYPTNTPTRTRTDLVVSGSPAECGAGAGAAC